MISGEKIKNILEWLQERYDAPENRKVEVQRLYSKLAVLELSGWVEDSIDTLVIDLANEKTISNNAVRRVKKSISSIKGFTYDKHFVVLLQKTIGIINEEAVVKGVRDRPDAILEKFISALNSLSKARNHHAHTFSQTPQQTHRFESPTTVIPSFNYILSGLQAFEEEIAKNQDIPLPADR